MLLRPLMTGIDDLEQLLGIEPVGERGEARDVREERRDEPALLGHLARRPRRGGRRPAAATKLLRVCEASGVAFAATSCGLPQCPGETHSLGVLATARRARPRRHAAQVRFLSGALVPTADEAGLGTRWSDEITVDMADPGQDPRGAVEMVSLWLLLDTSPRAAGAYW